MPSMSDLVKAGAGVPIIGAPEVMGSIVVVVMKCDCEGKPVLQVIAGQQAVCAACRAHWAVECKAEIGVRRVAA